MKPRLLKSFIVVVLFWFFATTMWWGLQQPEEIQQHLIHLNQLLERFNLGAIDAPEHPTIFNSIITQLRVLQYWSFPVLVGGTIAFFIGVIIVAIFAKKAFKARKHRETGRKQNFRGVTLTVGDLPVPDIMPKEEISLDGDERFEKLNHLEKVLIQDLMGVIAAHPDAYPGEGITTPLVEYSLTLLDQSLGHPKYPGLVSAVVLGRELAKVSAYQKTDTGTWRLTKRYDKECARILMGLESWNALSYVDKSAVLMAVMFSENPAQIPVVDGNQQIYSLARELIQVSESTQETIVQEEKKKTLDKADLPDVIFDAFLQSLPLLPFQSRGLPKGVSAVAWKFGNRVYLLEIKLRETVMNKLPQEIKGALTQTKEPGSKQRLHPFTAELLKSLRLNNWLITAIDNMKVSDKEALWKIKAGKLDFNGVIVVEVPDQYMKQLPSDDSMYEVVVTGPLYTSSATVINNGGSANSAARDTAGAGGGFSKNDLGSVLKPSSKPPVEKPSNT